jgi:putative membrane-bound dehydrogenase-like protein
MNQRGLLWARLTLLAVTAAAALSTRGIYAQGYPAADAPGHMTVAAGLEVRLVAAEPLVRQPVAIEFDDRGRLWVIQYMQYPNPAALRRVSVDRFSRTVYDHIPDPPPRGPRGTDRITILADTDGDGRADQSKDFVTGLNLASGLAFGYGGVFVIQVPYLLFYADRDRDDRPDGDPEVLLSGFGMEDAHSVANSLTWGPDGWLYGLQGSTVTAKIRGIEFQQGIWRYHPVSKRFELFCEGGGNMWGLDFDRRGRLFASTNVGGFVMLHAAQGGYYWKSFGKHGPLHNPYAFGYFDHVRHEGARGGHVSVGGLFYEADLWPPEWRGRYIAGDLLGHAVRAHEVGALGSTFRARQEIDVMEANDTWFAPSDLALGPDGGIYVADWHDRRTAHPDPDADWDRTNGRIYAIVAAKKSGPVPPISPLNTKTNDELVTLLEHPNTWYRRRARRMLAERHAVDMVPRLRQVAVNGRGTAALEPLWALHACGGLDQLIAESLLSHSDPDLRAWSVRLVGDEHAVPPRLLARFAEMATVEPDVTVRAQLACTARRLPAANGLDIAQRLLERDVDSADAHLPLLLWWAVEQHALANLDDTLARFTTPDAWRSALCRRTILERLIRRLVAEKSGVCDAACVRLLESAPSPEARGPLLGALDEAMKERMAESVAPVLRRAVTAYAEANPSDPSLTLLAARLASGPALDRARHWAANHSRADSDRLRMIELLGERKDRVSIDSLLAIATSEHGTAERVVLTALRALGRFEDQAIAATLVTAYPHRNAHWRAEARGVLLSRPSWARLFLKAVDQGAIPPDEITLDALGRFPAVQAPDLADLVRKHWGMTRGPTREERLAEIRRLNNDLRAASGDPARGRQLFRDRCASCHRLHGEGETIGPDLTFANRRDRDFLLVSLVDPAVVVRKEYQAFQAATKDGRILTGLIVDQTREAVTLRDAKGERVRLARSEIDEMKEMETSLMPDSLYKELRPDQLRDLFGYLQADAPAAAKKAR